jgi:hypothetical protein
MTDEPAVPTLVPRFGTPDAEVVITPALVHDLLAEPHPDLADLADAVPSRRSPRTRRWEREPGPT